MLRPKTLVAVATLSSALVSCSAASPPRLAEAERAAIADSLRQFVRVFEQGINALDVDRQIALFSGDADLTWANDGQLVLMPRDSLADLYRAFYRGMRQMTFAWDTLRVSVLSGDAGVVTAGGHYAATDTTGQTIRRGVAGTYVFARRNGTWQLVHGHASHHPL